MKIIIVIILYSCKKIQLPFLQRGNVLHQGVHILFFGVPAGAEAANQPPVGHGAFKFVDVVFAKLLCHMGRQQEELLVGGTLGIRLKALAKEGLANLQRIVNGALADFKVKSVPEQRVKLGSQQPTLGQHRTVLLDVVAEIALEIVFNTK